MVCDVLFASEHVIHLLEPIDRAHVGEYAGEVVGFASLAEGG